MTLVPTANPDVANNTAAHRYEIRADGRVAGFAAYDISGNKVVFTHTEIDNAFEGRGLGSHLAKAALDDVRQHHQRVQPRCPFIAAYIQRHAEYADLVDADRPGHDH
jgi:predicted GNAT family acetyltransferase